MIAVLLALIAEPQVVSIADDGPAWAEVRLALPGGAAADPKEKAGLAHVAAMMLERRLAAAGARVHLGRRGIAVALGAPSSRVENTAIDAIDAISREATTTEVDAAVRIASERRRRFADDDRALAEMELGRVLGGWEHALGSVDQIATITRDDVAVYQRRWWTADQITLVISGSFDPEIPKKLTARIEKISRPPAKKDSSGDSSPRRAGLRILLIDKPGRSRAHIAIGRRVEGIDAAKIAANAGLGGTMSGRLTAAVQRAPVVGTYAISTLLDGTLTVWAAVKPEQTPAAITRLLTTLAEVNKKGLDAEEIMLGKRAAAARAMLSQRDAAARADAAVRMRMSAIDREDPAKLLELGDDAVRKASQALVRSDGLAIVVVVSVTSELQSALLAIPGVKEVQVARYDLR